MTVLQGRQRLEATLSSPALTDKDNVYRMVASRLAAASPSPSLSSSSSSASPTSSTSLHTGHITIEGSQIHEIAQCRFVQVWNLLELLRSASGEENQNLTIMAEDDITSEGWKLKHDTGQLRVMYREGPKGTPFHTLLAEGLIYSPITSALCVAWEAPSYNLWWPQMTIPPFKVLESKWVKRGFNGEDISLIRVKVPWPLAAREVLMCAFELEVFDEELILVLLHSFPDTEESLCGHKPSEIPEALPDVVHMELAGGFALQKIASGQSYFRKSDPNFSAAPMASGEGQSNPSTSGDAGGNHNEDYGDEYGPPLPMEEELREMEHRRLVGEATNMMLNFTKDLKLAKYMTETAFQDVHAQWKATTTSPPKPDTKKQYSKKDLEEEVEARLAQIFDAHKKAKKHGKKRRKSTDFPGYLGRQSTFDKAKKHKKHAEVPSSSSSSFDSSSGVIEGDYIVFKRGVCHKMVTWQPMVQTPMREAVLTWQQYRRSGNPPEITEKGMAVPRGSRLR
ncbi:hypothetical protein L7F22_056760 [Adiantum nelumboides]|nr:hypothetical protein [Adiantum nelumboides]